MNKYTVIIPTRDRAETLEATIRTCLRQTYENFKVVVSDNCSSDNTKEIVSRFNDPRLSYINPGTRLSMAAHFEYALNHVQDGFIMFIGSDDGLMPDAIHYVDSIVEKYKVDAVSCRQATYVWPNFPDEEIAGRLTFGGVRDDIEIRNSSEWLEKTLNFQVHYCFDLPNLYCGFVNRRVVDKAYLGGKYFRSITPDAYAAFATAIFLEKYAFSHRPFVIAGASGKSNGASSLHPKVDSKEAEKFLLENDIPFFDGFVNCPSFEIILCETFAQLSEAFSSKCSGYQIKYDLMLLKALENANEKTRAEISAATREMYVNFMDKIRGRNLKSSRVSINNRSLLEKISSISIKFSNIVEIRKTQNFGIKDVDDAALVAGVLVNGFKNDLFLTRKKLILNRIKKIIDF